MIIFAVLVAWFIGWYLTCYALYNFFDYEIDYATSFVSIFAWPVILIILLFITNFGPWLEKSFIYLNKLFKIKS